MATVVSRRNSASQVVGTLASMIKSLLGLDTVLKCIVEDDGENSILVGCAAQLMQHLDVMHPMYNVINSAVQTHHQIHGTCCRTLVVMSGLWLSAMEDLMQSGISTADILSAFHVGLEYCTGCLFESPVTITLDSDLSESTQFVRNSVNIVNIELSSSKTVNDSPTAVPSASAWEADIERTFRNEPPVMVPFVCSNDIQRTVLIDRCVQDEDRYVIPAGHSGGAKVDAILVKKTSAGEKDDDLSWFFAGEPDSVMYVSSLQPQVECSERLSAVFGQNAECKSFLSSGSRKSQPDNMGDVSVALNLLKMNGDADNIGKSIEMNGNANTGALSIVMNENARLHGTGISQVDFDEFDDCFEIASSIGANGSVNISYPMMPIRSSVIVSNEIVPNCVNESSVATTDATCLSSYQNVTSPCDYVATSNSFDCHQFEEFVSQNVQSLKCDSRQLDRKTTKPSSLMSDNSIAQLEENHRMLRFSSNFQDSLERYESPRLALGSFLRHDVIGDDRQCDRSESLFSRLQEHGMRLGRGCNSMMQVAVDACCHQIAVSKCARFDVNRVHTHQIAGMPTGKSCVVSGCLVRVTSEQIALVSSIKPRNALMINADVTLTYRHQGYQRPEGLSIVRRALDAQSREERWLTEVMEVINELNVTAIFIKGTASSSLIERCLSDHILVITLVPYSALLAISEGTGAAIGVYVNECCQQNVARDIMIEPLRADWMDSTSQQLYATVKTPYDLIQTAIVCHPVANVAEVNEEKLMHCLRRLQGLTVSLRVLRGGGQVEDYCAWKLEQLSDVIETSESCPLQDAGNFPVAVMRAMAESFRAFRDIVRLNVPASSLSTSSMDLDDQHASSSCHVYDDFEGKLAAWRTALYIAGLTVQIDMEIVASDRNCRQVQDFSVIGYL